MRHLAQLVVVSGVEGEWGEGLAGDVTAEGASGMHES